MVMITIIIVIIFVIIMVANINITVSSQSLTKLYCLLVVYTAVNLITTYSVICLLFLLDLLLYSSLIITANKVERLLVIATHTNTHENKQTHASSYKNTYINLYAYTNTHPHSQTHTEKNTNTHKKSHTQTPSKVNNVRSLGSCVAFTNITQGIHAQLLSILHNLGPPEQIARRISLMNQISCVVLDSCVVLGE